jgi:hypothetical protein
VLGLMILLGVNVKRGMRAALRRQA